ncbi:MAG: GIY-YIG nuclease family protein [Turicibacter sp.]|nr:GIY-YIG nuclease family protein [Turicibacter sp.]
MAGVDEKAVKAVSVSAGVAGMSTDADVKVKTAVKHFVYMLQCSDGTFYMGYSTEVGRRVREHNESPKAAKYTRGRRPVRLVYYVECESRSDALKCERLLRKKSRVEKEKLMNEFDGDLDV